MKQQDINDFCGKIDFGIITIREDEYQAVLKYFGKEFLVRGERTYVVNQLITDNGMVYWIAIVRCPEQGTTEGQNVAQTMIAELNPDWLLLVGIAGGIPHEDFSLGDVVLASRFHDFSLEAVDDTKATEFGNQGGPMHPKVMDLLGFLPALTPEISHWFNLIDLPYPKVSLNSSNFYGDEDWNKKLADHLQSRFFASGKKIFPRVTITEFASSNRLVKSPRLIKTWKQTTRFLRTVEMELAGVYRAARKKKKEYPVLVIRGISDIIGFKREDAWTGFACHTAAAFAFALLQTGIVKNGIQGSTYPTLIQIQQNENLSVAKKIETVQKKLEDMIEFIEKHDTLWDDQYILMTKGLGSIQSIVFQALNEAKNLKGGNPIQRSFKLTQLRQETRNEASALLEFLKEWQEKKKAGVNINETKKSLKKCCHALTSLIEETKNLFIDS